MRAAPDAEIVFDASGLEYISSAGLRVLMKVRQSVGYAVEIRGVSPNVYEILEMTGFTELMRVKKRLREVSVEGCEVIGRGFYGTVYRLDPDTIVKVYASPDSISLIENERKMARMAFVKGIPYHGHLISQHSWPPRHAERSVAENADPPYTGEY